MDNYRNIDKCHVCNSVNITEVLTASDYLVSKEKFNILECKNCSLRFTSPIPNEQNIEKYYKSDEYISHFEKGDSLINKIYKIVQKFTLRLKKQQVENQFNRQQGSLLDIGCGTGDFLYTMKNSDWAVSGVEVNKDACKIAEEKVGNNILSPNEFLSGNNKYDVITMWHSLEHLYDLKKYVKKIINSINENGLLFIAVPNYQSIDAKYYKENWAAYDVPRHLYHFSFKAMEQLFNENGYAIVSYKYLPFDPFYVSILSETAVKEKHNILVGIFIGLKSFIGGIFNTKKASSILYVLKKEL